MSVIGVPQKEMSKSCPAPTQILLARGFSKSAFSARKILYVVSANIPIPLKAYGSGKRQVEKIAHQAERKAIDDSLVTLVSHASQ